MSLRSLAVLGLVGCVAGGTALIAAAPSAPDRNLLRKAGEFHLLTGRYGAAAVAAGEFIYVMGGATSGGLLTDIERFNPRTGQSERIYDKLIPRRYHGAVEHRGRIFLFGGDGYGLRTQPFESAVEVYDLAANVATVRTRMPVPRANLGIAKAGTKVYLVGGMEARDERRLHTGRLDVFDLSTETWTAGPAMPTPREARAEAVTGFVIVPAGYRAGMRVANVEMFVPAENSWKALPPLTRRQSAHSLAWLDRYLFLFGDYDDFNMITAYDLKTRSTLDVAADFIGGRHTVAVSHAGRIYVIGGCTDQLNSESERIEVFELATAGGGPVKN